MPEQPSSEPGIHLTRTAENADEIEALATLLGGRVGIDGVLADLDRRGRRGLAPGRAVSRSLTWDRADRRTTRWWPQGISTSADASATGDIGGREVLAVSWYAKRLGDGAGHGTRVSFIDLRTRRYRHVLLVVPSFAEDGTLRLEPLRVHAGGIVWCGPWLHVAATARGFLTCRVDDLLRVPDERCGDASRIGVDGDRVSTYGYRYVLPVRFAYRAHAGKEEERLRFSFLSLDRAASELVVGEYGRRGQTRRLARFPLERDTLLLSEDDEGRSLPVGLEDARVRQMQGAAAAGGEVYATVSRGPFTPGSVYVGRPGSLREHRWAVPMGPEDLAYWPATDTLWSVTEHPHRRWVFAMRRAWFDR